MDATLNTANTDSKSLQKVVIVAAQRSAIGTFGKTLSSVSARTLGTQVLTQTIDKASIEPSAINKVIIGNVLSAGLGQNIARQISIDAQIPASTPAFCVNQVCGSSLQAIILASQAIQLGECDVVVAGGVESMSQAPYVLPQARWGSRMGHHNMIDTMIQDGLWDAFEDYHMGQTAEHIAEKWHIDRETQDKFALESQQKAIQAWEQGAFLDEVVPIAIPQRKGDALIFDKDEYIRTDVSKESLARLKPAFKKDGTVTAGNASGINDGASMIILSSESYALAHNLKILGRVAGYNTIGIDPSIMGYAPMESIRQMSSTYNIALDSIDRFEINEAFAVQSLAVVQDLELDPEKVNINGGAIALGHPIGASGARILCTLVHGMNRNSEHRGIASLCVGGGMGVSVYVER